MGTTHFVLEPGVDALVLEEKRENEEKKGP